MEDSPHDATHDERSYDEIIGRFDEEIQKGGVDSLGRSTRKSGSEALRALFNNKVFLSLFGLSALSFFVFLLSQGGSPALLSEANEIRFGKHSEAVEELKVVDHFMSSEIQFRSTRSPEFRSLVHELNEVLYEGQSYLDDPFLPEDFLILDDKVMYRED